MISKFAVSKVLELVELCAEKRGRCHRVNMDDFRNAIDGWEIGRKEAHNALRVLERKIYLLTMSSRQDDEITDIVITTPTYRCHECRLVVSSRQEWEDHLPDYLHQRGKSRKLGLIV
jgi:hypothetical protein